jgi:CubicO group peptidase (beta-lactamase class C family)
VPVNAESFRADDLFYDTPGGRVWSTIEDMGRFAIGIINNTYYSEQTLQTEVLQVYGSDSDEEIGLGWYLSQVDPDDPAIYHAGSNGVPRAFLAVKPNSGHAVCLTGRNRSGGGADDFGALAIELMEIAVNIDR